MSLRSKTIVLAVAAIATLLAIIYGVSSAIFLSGFARLEEDSARANVERVLQAYGEAVAKVDFTTADWAGWDDTYAYIKDGNKAYEQADLTVEALGTAGIAMSVVAYVKPSGELRYATGVDLTRDAKVPLPQGLLPHLRPTGALMRHRDEKSRVSGLLLLPEGPLLVSSRPILTSEKKGPIRGTLVFGRVFNDAAVEHLAKVTHFGLMVRPVADDQLPPDFLVARDRTARHTIHVRPLGDASVAGYVTLYDIHDQPALLLRVEMPRSIYQQGLTAMQYFLVSLLSVGALLGGAALILFDRLILAQMARHASEQRFRDLFENANDIVFTTDLEGNITSVNRAGERITGYTRAEVLRMTAARIVAPEYLDLIRDVLLGRVKPDETGAHEIELITKNGRRVPVEVSVRLTYEGGQMVGAQGIARDITERKHAEAALRQSEERYALAAQGANDGLWDWDLTANRIYYSPRWKAMLGCAEGEIGNSPDEWLTRVHTDDLSHLKTQLAAHLDQHVAHFQAEYRILHKEGSYRWMIARGVAVRAREGRASRIAGSQTDITERKVAELQLLHDAFHDGLTDLPNRALFIDRLAQAIRRAKRRPDYKFAVLFLDIDRFKVVNDSLGHVAGDELLRGIGLRLSMSLRPADTVARLGGDEFAVLLDEIKHVDDGAIVAGRLLDLLHAPVSVCGNDVVVTASIGIAPSSPLYERPEDYLRDADTAMYRAKELGKARYVIFTPEMHTHAVAQLQLERDLRKAVELEAFHLHYQPVVSMQTGAVVGLEALIRWQHPDGRAVAPADFIPLAEETGLIVPLGQWVLREACRQALAWNAPNDPAASPYVGVNISARQLAQPDFVARVAQILTETGLDPRRLDLEITESTIMEDVAHASGVLGELRRLDVRITVDDFGTGYSSLGALRRFPITALKIDRSFISRMHASDEDEEMVRAILALARRLGMEVVAEGVETIDQLATLKTLGCEYAQGFYFARPADISVVAHLLGTPAYRARIADAGPASRATA